MTHSSASSIISDDDSFISTPSLFAPTHRTTSSTSLPATPLTPTETTPLLGPKHDAEANHDTNNDTNHDETLVFQNLWILPALAIGVFLGAADQTIVVSSYGQIGSEMNALDQTGWLATG